MKNSDIEWRINFAKHLAKRLETFEGIKAIVIAGSVARGYADEYSDIEIPIFWDTLPTDATRHAIVNTLNAKFLYAYDGPAHEDQLIIDGIQVDLWDISTTHQEEVLNDVLCKHHFDLGTLNALDTIRSCIPLFGHEIVQKWKLHAQEYPEELAEKIIQEHLTTFSIGGLFILAKRDNPTAFYSQLSLLQQEAFLVLLALNRRYFPTFKWLYQTLNSMQIKPDAIDRRFRKAYEMPYAEAIENTKSILEEIVHLVERQFPQIDTSLVSRQLSYTRVSQNADAHIVFPTESLE